jgi:hypothetical protein
VQIIELLKRNRALDSVTDIVKFYLIVKQRDAPSHADPGRPSASASHQCYQVLGAVHALWPPVPGSIKDYISTPKQNGYQGLHSSLLTLGCSTVGSVEIIVHTEEMHERADYGIATEAWPRPMSPLAPASVQPQCGGESASWDLLGLRRIFNLGSDHPANGAETRSGVAAGEISANGNDFVPGLRHASSSGIGLPLFSINGKGAASSNDAASSNGAASSYGNSAACGANGRARALTGGYSRLGPVEMSRRVNWLESIRLWQEEFLSTFTASEFMEVMHKDLLGRTIFAFTPSGDIMRLPKGATVVDFAYHVHTEVGNSMISSRVNGVVELPSYELRNAGVPPRFPASAAFSAFCGFLAPWPCLSWTVAVPSRQPRRGPSSSWSVVGADVVDIVRYTSSALHVGHLRRHRSWLPLARTQSAKHKLQAFVREQEKVFNDKELADGPQGAPSPPAAPLTARPALLINRAWAQIRCMPSSSIV